jgi:hypothetical protein
MYTNRRCTEDEFEVRHISQTVLTFSVNLTTRDCSCRKWLLTGLPCVHAIASMRYMELDFYQFVPDLYRKERYEECYRPIFHPVNGQPLWERTAYTDLQPPPIRRQPGRPKKKRNKEPSELIREDGQMKRASYGTKCSRCKQPGHNKATCKLPPPPPAAENSTASNPTDATNPNATNPPAATNPPDSNPPAATNPPFVATQESSITAPPEAQAAKGKSKKQPAKSQSAEAKDAKGKAKASSNSQGSKKRLPINTAKTLQSVPNTKRQKLPFTRGPQHAAGPPSK